MNSDRVPLLHKSNRAAEIRLRSYVADTSPLGGSGKTAIRNQGDALSQTHPNESGGGEQLFPHPRTSLGALVANNHHIPGADFSSKDGPPERFPPDQRSGPVRCGSSFREQPPQGPFADAGDAGPWNKKGTMGGSIQTLGYHRTAQRASLLGHHPDLLFGEAPLGRGGFRMEAIWAFTAIRKPI